MKEEEDEDIEENGKLLSRYTDTSFNSSILNKNSFIDSNNLSGNNEAGKRFGDFVLMMDNKEEYKKALILSAVKKVWKVVDKIKHTKDISLIANDPSSTKWYIISPEKSITRDFFEYIFCFILYIDFIFSPFEFCVYHSSYSMYRIIIFDIIFALEMASHFFTSYYDAQNKFYVTDMKKIFIHYLKGGLIPNFLYVFPFHAFYHLLEMLRLIKLYRYPFVNSKIKKVATKLLSLCIKNMTLYTQIIRVFTFFLSICYITHICACIYCYLGLNNQNSWVYNHSDYFDNTSILEIYVNSYYFLAETLSSTGYGDLTPTNFYEISFIMLCEIINCGLYAYLLSNILDILLNMDKSNYNKDKYSNIQLENCIIHYMKKLPSSSRGDNLHRNEIWEKTKAYFELYYNPTRNLDWINDKNFIEQMKPLHRKELMNSAFEHIFEKFDYFFNNIYLSSSKIKIVKNLKISIQSSGTVLFNNSNKCHKIFFIEKGSVNLFHNFELVNTLNEGNIFGLESLLQKGDNFDKISYKVSDEIPYVIVYYIDISFLITEILNYDKNSYIGLLKFLDNYIDKVYHKENNINENNINNIIDTSNNNILNDNKIEQKQKVDTSKFGCIPDLEDKLNQYKNTENLINESSLKLNLMDKQIDFVNKYLNKMMK